MKSLHKNLLPFSTAAITFTEDFINKFRELKIEEKDILFSFDIENMYPSIDKEEIMKIVSRKIKDKFGINKVFETLISTSILIINKDHFVFDNIVYRQQKDLPIGSPISGILAKMKLRILEEQIKIKYKN